MSTAPMPFPRPDRRWSPASWLAVVAGGMATVAVLAQLGARDFISPNALFHPHGFCYLWQTDLVAAHVASDALIALSYLTISVTLVYLVWRARQEIPFGWMFLCFGTFIVACGATHAMEIVTLWQPLFWLSADVKIVTALASVATAIALPPLVPKVLGVVSAASVSEQRRLALERANDELERRVAERTAQLSEAMEREQSLRAAAEQASRMKDDFLSTVSHELRTPLNAILGWSDVLCRQQLSPEASARALTSISRNARAQAQLVDDLLDTSRVVAGKLRMERETVALEHVIQTAIDTMRPSADAKGIAIRHAGTWEPAFVAGDSHRLQQVFWNLLSNAVKFTPDGGIITIALTCVGEMAHVEVTDTGIGIDPAFVPYLFERFRQADSSSARRHMGLGLGLALSQHIAGLHGGRIHAHSGGIARGSTFVVDLPTTIAPAVSGGPNEAGAVPVSLDGVSVLVVDDDRDGLQMVADVLQAAGAVVLTSESVADALRHATSVDVIVSDIGMPNDSGYDLIRRVRQELHLDVPAIALTAYVRDEDRAAVLEAGFRQHLGKPVAPSELVHAVASVSRA